MKVLVLSGGDFPSQELLAEELAWSDYIICADHGCDMLTDLNYRADLLVGDLDSFTSNPSVSALKIEKYSPIKDDTDTGLAMEKAIELKASEIHLLGAVGSRLDHSLANILLMEKYMLASPKILLLNDTNRMQLVGEGIYNFKKSHYSYISVLSISDTMVYSTRGMKYEVHCLLINRHSNRGVSNEIKEKDAYIEVHQGKALIIESKD